MINKADLLESDPSLEATSEDLLTLADLFQALADPTRLRLLTLLLAGEHCVHELVELSQVGQSAVSHQLRLLRDRRLVRARRDGRHVYYRLDDPHVRDLLTRALVHIQHD